MLILFISILGLLIGSFLNVCIYRLPLKQSIVTPPSHCMTCNTRLQPWNLIPVISYLATRGRCSYCKTPYSLRYPMIELLTAGLFLWCLDVFGFSLALVKPLVLTAFFIVITFIDYDHQLILNKVLIYLAIIGVALNLGTGSVEPFPMLLDGLIGGLVGGGLLLLIACVSKGGMGGGDIKFSAVLGLCLGWQCVLLTLFLSFIFGGVIGALLLLSKIKNRKDFIPFGPFIALGALISLLYGNNIITWYIGNL